MDSVYVPILLGSVRIGRRSGAVAAYILARLAKDPRFKSELLDLADYHFEILEQRPSEMDEPPHELEAFSAKLRDADALLVVSPEYKAGIPGGLKNAFDLLEPGILRRKPVGICTVSAGGFGGLQCSLQLRSTIFALGGVPIPETILVSRVQEYFDEEGNCGNQAKVVEMGRFLDELHFYADSLKRGRQRDLAQDRFDRPASASVLAR